MTEDAFEAVRQLAREILERQIAGTPVQRVDARIRYLQESGQTTRAANVLRARIKAYGEPIGLQSGAGEHKKGTS